ncbi:hypothetical protein C8R47DRAFT_1208802 [Mycena vitilis]|nr:hypothetical protein C8R47DRAFT_1208802 [Mycena vitilis]
MAPRNTATLQESRNTAEEAVPSLLSSSSTTTTTAMKPYNVLCLLAVAIVAGAQSSDPAGGVSISNPLSPIITPSSTPAVTPSSSDPVVPPTSSDPPTSSAPPPTSTSDTPPPASSTTPPTTPTSTPPPSVSKSVGTDSAGDAVTVDVTVTNTPAVSGSSSSASSSATSGASDGGGGSTLSTGGIIGLAVAGGTALVCLIGFFVWKFTRKRGADFDDSENIKWPELNAHNNDGGDSHAMPVHNTGRAGFSDADDLSRAPSVNTFNASSVDFHGEDPYAVPPLPHLNPGLNQPYHDDPVAAAGGAGAYYDPYRGPVPQTFNDAHGAPPPEWGQQEAIPMTQMAGPGGRASPAPMMGRASPGPQMMYAGGRTPSPGPQAAYGGGGPARMGSPGPQAAYGGGPGRIASPGPQMAYGPA